MEILGQFGPLFVLVALLTNFTVNGNGSVSFSSNNNSKLPIDHILNKSEVKHSSSSGPISRRLSSLDLLKSFRRNGSSSSDSSVSQQNDSQAARQVQILETGSVLREERGEQRILKRGPAPLTSGSGKERTRFNDSLFNLKNSLNKKSESTRNGYASGFDSIPVIAIPSSNIPPPVYSYTGDGARPPPPHPSVVTVDSYQPGGVGGGVVVVETTSQPAIIIPPETNPPRPIGPAPVTSVPIIGGGGSGGSILPPSPPPEEILPPAPPPGEEDEFIDARVAVGRGLNVPGERSTGGTVRTRTRVVASVPKEDFGSQTSRERFRIGSGNLRRERLRDKVKQTSYGNENDPAPEEVFADDPDVITDFVFSDIRCFKTRQNEYFGATIHLKNGFHLPYIRDRPQDPLTTEECRLEQVEGARGSYHMAVTDLRGCGVDYCGEAMCLTMVFPRVPSLALADDEVTTIKCIPQKSTISDTKSISFAGDSMENRRSSSTVEGGIQEFVAEVGVFRQNPGSTNGLFVKRVNSGGVVQLGELLQLRSVVRGTDGWKHAKLTDVKVWRMRDNVRVHSLDAFDSNQASEVITLVDQTGCRNQEYVVIAEDHPIKDPRNDMVHHFTFKAFLFRGQRVNEPLIVTAKVHACHEAHDCIMICETGHRVKRSPVEIHNASALVLDQDSNPITLRVVGLKDHPSSFLDDEFAFDYTGASQLKNLNRTAQDLGALTCNEKMFATGLGGGCIMLLICGLVLALYTYFKQGNLYSSRKHTTNYGGGYRFPPPPGRAVGGAARSPYQKPLPPTPTTPSSALNPESPFAQKQVQAAAESNESNTNGKIMNSNISEVAKLLQELAKKNGDQDKEEKGKGKSSNKTTSNNKIKEASEYACIDETNSSGSSSSTSLEDLRKSFKSKDGLYFVYCYNKDKKIKAARLPQSAPSSTRMRRKQIQGRKREDHTEADEDSETMGSQTEDVSEESDDYVKQDSNNNVNGNIVKNQGARRTVREVKKKSKQNNNIRCSGIRRRVSSVYREGYLNGIRGAVVAAGTKVGNSFPLKYKSKSPSTSNIPAATTASEMYNNSSSGKRIHFSVRERRSSRKRRQPQEVKFNSDQYSSEGILSETEATKMASDLDSAYSGSNCSKLTEDRLYDLKCANGANLSGRCPDFHNFHKLHQNLLDVQRQLVKRGTQGQKLDVRRTASSPNDSRNMHNTTAVAIGLASPPLPLGETKATHFVTRDDSSTKILIVPETHV